MNEPLIQTIRDALGECPLTRAVPEQIDQCEQQLGFALLPFLRELYLTVGNGGFDLGGATLIGVGKGGYKSRRRH